MGKKCRKEKKKYKKPTLQKITLGEVLKSVEAGECGGGSPQEGCGSTPA